MGKAEDFLREQITSRYTFTQFAEKSGLPRSSIYHLIENVDAIPIGKFRKIVKALDLNPNDLLQVDWESDRHVQMLSEEEYRLLEVYRNNQVMHGVIDSIINGISDKTSK